MKKYTISVICAGILWGIISFFLRGLNTSGLTSLQILFIRGSLSAFFLFFVLLFTDKSLLKIQIRDLWMFIGTGVVSLSFFSFCYFTTILESGASVAVILLYTSPIFVLIFSFFLFKEKITFLKMIALVLTFLGCVLTAGFFGGKNSITVKGLLLGLCSGLGYALYSIFSRFALKKYNILTIIFYTFLFSTISILPFCGITGIVKCFSSTMLFYSVCISILCTVLPYILYTNGLKGLETSKAAIFVTVEPLVGALLGFFLYKESISIEKLIGISLIFISIILCSLPDSNKKAQ